MYKIKFSNHYDDNVTPEIEVECSAENLQTTIEYYKVGHDNIYYNKAQVFDSNGILILSFIINICGGGWLIGEDY